MVRKRVSQPQRVVERHRVAHVDHDVGRVTDRHADSLDETQIIANTVPKLPPAELHRRISVGDVPPGGLDDCVVSLGCEVARIGAQQVAPGAAEKAMDRLTAVLSEDVPQRDVDAAHGLNDDAPAAISCGVVVHERPKRIDVERVPAHEKLLQPLPRQLRNRSVYDRLQHERDGMCFADPNKAFIRVYADDQRVLQSVAIGEHNGQTQDDRLDISNDHAMTRWSSQSIFGRQYTAIRYNQRPR